MNLFEQATRQKLRFTTPKGMIGVEDLWYLPLTSNTARANLVDLAIALNAELSNAGRGSFVDPITTKNSVTQLMFDIVIHVINTKIAEAKAAESARQVREKKQKIMAIIEQKQDEALRAASLDDLQAMLASL